MTFSWICNKTQRCEVAGFPEIGKYDPVEKLNQLMETHKDWKSTDKIYVYGRCGEKFYFQHDGKAFTIDIPPE